MEVLASCGCPGRGEKVVGVVDADDVRRIAISLPHTVEIDSDGFDFRVGNRGFVWSYPEYIPGQRRVISTDIAVLYVGDEAEKQALLLSEPYYLHLRLVAAGDGPAHLIEAAEPAGSLRHQLRSEGAVAVPRHRQLDVADLTGDHL